MLEKVWRRLSHRTANDPVERRLHRAGWNLERLNEIGANADRDHDGHEDDFDVLAPDRVLRWRQVLRNQRIKSLRFFMGGTVVARLDGYAHLCDLALDFLDRGGTEQIAPVANQLFRMTDEKKTVFDIARLKHAAKRYPRNEVCKVLTAISKPR